MIKRILLAALAAATLTTSVLAAETTPAAPAPTAVTAPTDLTQQGTREVPRVVLPDPTRREPLEVTVNGTPTRTKVEANPQANATSAPSSATNGPITVTVNPPPQPTAPVASQTCPPGQTCVVTNKENRVHVVPPRAASAHKTAKPKERVHHKVVYRTVYVRERPRKVRRYHAPPPQDRGVTVICGSCNFRGSGFLGM
jgi:hypothetical protein